MKIAIIVAMQKEMALLQPLIEGAKEQSFRRNKIITGRIGVHEVAAAICGIGKVNAALCTREIIDFFKPNLLINTGVAGGADPSMKVLDLLVADRVAYHDVWCGPDTSYGAAAGFDVFLMPDEKIVKLMMRLETGNKTCKKGLICSGDKFISQAEEVAEIKRHFPDALAVDMESGAIAQVCTIENVPFAIVRAVSDTPGQEENISQYQNFWTDAPAETFSCLRRLLRSL